MADTIEYDPEIAELAANLQFASTGGGPFLIAADDVVTHWHGTLNADGEFIYQKQPCDYDRACKGGDGPRVIAIGGGQGLVLGTPDNSAFVLQPDGLLIVRSIGCDDEAQLVTAALQISDDDVDPLEETFSHAGGRLRMFDSALSHTKIDGDNGVTEVELPAGRYAITAPEEWSGEVLDIDGNGHDTMVQVVRLRRL